MALQDYKITDTDIQTKGVVSAPDRLTGTAQQNKAVFDKLIREVVKGYFNSVVDALANAGGATEVGFTDINGITAQNVQSAISTLKALVDTKASEAITEAELALKSDKADTDLHFKDVGFAENTGVFTFTREDGTTKTIDTVLEKIAVNFEYDSANQRIVLTLKDGTKQYISLSDFITEYEFQDSSTIAFSIASHVVSASIKNGSITDQMLSSSLIAQLEGYVTDASTYASNASASEQNALAYRNQAQTAKTESESARDIAVNAKDSAQADANTAVGAKNEAVAAKDQAEAAARSATTIVESVYNIIVSDQTIADTKWAVFIDNGSICIIEVANTLEVSEITFVDKTTGKAYKMIVDNGILGIEEVE